MSADQMRRSDNQVSGPLDLPSDRAEMLASIGRASKKTLCRRLFAPKRGFSEREMEFFLNVDFVGRVALAAVPSEGARQRHRTGDARSLVAPRMVTTIVWPRRERFATERWNLSGTPLLDSFIARS